MKGTTDNNEFQMEFAFPLMENDSQDLDYSNVNCCEIPNIIMESGCETCKSCGWSACIIA